MNVTLPGLAARRLRHRLGVAIALGAGLAAALGLTATVLVGQVMATEAGLGQTLTTDPDTGLMTVQSDTQRTYADYGAFESAADRRVSGALNGQERPVVHFAAMSPVALYTRNGQPASTMPYPSLASSSGLAEHVRVLSGTLPPDVATTGDHPVAVSENEPYGLAVGDRVCLGFAGRRGSRAQPLFPLCLRVTAVFRALDPAGDYWQGRDVDAELVGSSADVFGGLREMNAASDIPQVAATTGAVYRLRAAAVDASNADAIAGAIRGLRGYYSVRSGGVFVATGDTAIGDFEQRQQVGGYTVQLVAAALLLIGLFAVSFVARQFLDEQAPELGTLRARGWRRGRVLGFLLIQLGLLLLAAIPAGAGLAAAATLALRALAFGNAPGLARADLLGVVPPLAAALVAAALLLGALAALAARRDVLDLRRAASRPAAPAWWRWRAADVVLAALAVPLLAESRLLGADQVRAAGAAEDPLSVLLPALAIALLAVAGLRLLPAVSAVALAPVRDVPGRLARWQLSRQPAQHAGLALLVTFAVAVGVFSSVYATTDRLNAGDRAAYQAGADVRVTYNLPPPRLDLLAASLPGAAATSPALRVQAGPGTLGGAAATTLAIDPATFPDVAWSRPGLTDPPLPDLVRRLAAGDPDGLLLPGRPRTLSVWAWYAGTGEGDVSAQVVDAGGRSGRLDLGPPGAGTGWRQLQAPVRVAGAAQPGYPVRLRGMVVSGPAHGTLALSDLAVDGGVVEAFAGDHGWWTAESDTPEDAAVDRAASDAQPRDGRPTTVVPLDLPNGSLTLQPPVSSLPVPALISRALLQSLSIGLGQPFSLYLDTGPIRVTAVEAVDVFPTLYPGDRFIVLPLDAIVARTERIQPGDVLPDELWVATRGRAPAIPARLRDAGLPQEIDVRSALTSAALADPLRQALDGTLAIGFVATLGVALLAFAIHFVSISRTRLREYAILRANGLAPEQVQRSLLLEQAILLAHGLLAGGALGVAVSLAVLPAVELGGSPSDLVPATVVSVDPLAMAGAALALGAGGLLTGWLARRSATRLDVREHLRQL
jgi:hypothetical protein